MIKEKLSKLHLMVSLQQLDLNEYDPWNLQVDSKHENDFQKR